MLVGSIINLELYWKGDYTYGGDRGIRIVDITMDGDNDELYAHINTDLPSTQEQRLNFTINSKDDRFKRETTCSSINSPIDLVKSMKVSARIFQSYVDPWTRQQRLRKDDLPVFFDDLPEFQPDETYQIKIVSEDNNLRATIEKKVNEVATQKFPEPQMVQSVQEGREAKRNIFTDFEGIGEMVKDASTPTAMNELSANELQNKLDAAKLRCKPAMEKFNKSFKNGNQIAIQAASTEILQLGREIRDLESTLEDRGFIQYDFS